MTTAVRTAAVVSEIFTPVEISCNVLPSQLHTISGHAELMVLDRVGASVKCNRLTRVDYIDVYQSIQQYLVHRLPHNR